MLPRRLVGFGIEGRGCGSDQSPLCSLSLSLYLYTYLYLYLYLYLSHTPSIYLNCHTPSSPPTDKYLCALPKSSAKLDGPKWAKFAKLCPDVLDNRVQPTDIDLIFAKCKAKGERQLTFVEFRDKAMQMLAEMKYPWIPKEEVLNEFLRNHVYVWEKTEALMWVEARRLAIVAEARQQCACKKMQSIFRMRVDKEAYKETLVAVGKIQNKFKLHLVRLVFLKKLKAFRYERGRRLREIAEKRRQRKVALLYRECKNIDGTLNLISAL